MQIETKGRNITENYHHLEHDKQNDFYEYFYVVHLKRKSFYVGFEELSMSWKLICNLLSLPNLYPL